MARFLSISLTDLVLKTPKATLDIKELRVDISKDGGPEAALFVKLLLFPINVHLVESRVTSDQSVSSGGSLSANQLHGGACAPFSCEEFSLLCELGHNREAGIVIRNLDVTFGEVHVNLNEDLLLKKKGLSETSSSPASVVPADKESGSAEKPQGKQKLAAISKFTSIFPEKAAFTLPKLDVTVAHRGYGLMLENNIMGVQLKLMKSRSVEDVGESAKLDIQLEFSEIHLLREVGISIVEILKLDVVSSVYIPLQLAHCGRGFILRMLPQVSTKVESKGDKPSIRLGSTLLSDDGTSPCTYLAYPLLHHQSCQVYLSRLNAPLAMPPSSPIRSEIDVKLGGTQCNLVLNRLEPWMRIRPPPKPKKETVEESSAKEKSKASEQKAIMWTCTLSAPEMTVVLYSLNGFPVYHSPSQSLPDITQKTRMPWVEISSNSCNPYLVPAENSLSCYHLPTSLSSFIFLPSHQLLAPPSSFHAVSRSVLSFYGCSQSSHIFANNISSTGATLHMELGELNLHMSDEYQECLKESLFGVETNTGSLMHIAKVSLDLGKKDTDSPEDVSKSKMVLGVDVTGMGLYFTFRRLESLVLTALSFKALVKRISASSKKPAQSKGIKSSKPSGKGIQLLKLNLEKCSVNVCGDVGLDDIVIPDAKRVDYGSQGGRVLISNLADGTLRTAHVMPTTSEECRKLNYSVSLDIYHFSFCMNKEKKSMQMELERAKSIYQEFGEDNNPGAKVPLFDMQNAKLVRRSGGLKEIEVCSLFSATNISLRWEPDLHISLFELGLKLKLVVQNHKHQGHDDGRKFTL
ncbi:UNVERIFIED_CONTAM: protein SABRE [Sesamum radiatum]|uniref:Protein SABRE n=1 Tax=Sesamum radiatum TaxID=300843 RepID=A0AAW2SID6_SESRA